MTEVADLYVVLRSVGGQFEQGMARAGAAAGAADSKIAGVTRSVKMVSLAMAGAGLLVAGAALKMSSEFDRAMEQLHTLAHVPQGDIKELGSEVLKVAGQVGFAPTSLASALYHIESTFASVGISGKKAMDILTIAAKGAQIGGADLTDVTNALDAAVISGIPGVKNIHQAMGALLATVGAGDMTMQNLADALGTGVLAIAKQYGPTLADVGAALATFGDNNIRGSKAATDLRMVIMDLVKQGGPGVAALKHIGIAAGELGDVMSKHGLNAAILDLHKHLDAAGIKGTEVGKVLTDAFTKRSSAPLAILLGELGQFESKYPELAKGATGFGDAWAKTADLMSTKAKMAKANIESAFIGLGHALQPIAKTLLDAFNHAFDWAKTHQATIKELADKLKFVLYGALILVAGVLAEMAVEAAIAAAPFILLAAGIGLLAKKMIDLYHNNAQVREFVKTLVTAFKKDAVEAVHFLTNAFNEARQVVSRVIGAIIGFYHSHQASIDGMARDVVGVMKLIWSTMQAGFAAVKAIVTTAVKIIEDLWDRFGQQLWKHVVTAWNAIVQVVRGALQVLKGVFEVITGILTGNWSKFWKGIKDIVSGIWKVIEGLVKSAMNTISVAIGAGMAAISAAWGLVWNTIKNLAGKAWEGIQKIGKDILNWFKRLPHEILGLLKGAGKWLYDIGKDIIMGLVHGIEKGMGKIKHAISGIKNAVVGGIKSIMGIFSPSRVMRDEVGMQIVAGLALGIRENTKMATRAAHTLAAALIKELNEIKTKLAGTADQARSAFDSLLENARKAGVGAHELNKLHTAEDQLVKKMNERATVATKLAAAMDKLKAAQAAYQSTLDSVKSAVTGTFDVTNVQGQTDADGNQLAPTGGDMLASITAAVANAKKFYADLQALKKKGLPTALLAQLAQAGPSALPQADALMGASAADFTSIKTAYGNPNSIAQATGKMMADTLNGAGVQAAQGLVTGLKSQEAAITKAIKNIADKMVAELKKDLKISSPSRLTHEIGSFVGMGLANGMMSQKSLVASASRSLAGASSGSLLNGMHSPGYSGSTVPVQIDLYLDGKKVAANTRKHLLQQGKNIGTLGLS